MCVCVCVCVCAKERIGCGRNVWLYARRVFVCQRRARPAAERPRALARRTSPRSFSLRCPSHGHWHCHCHSLALALALSPSPLPPAAVVRRANEVGERAVAQLSLSLPLSLSLSSFPLSCLCFPSLPLGLITLFLCTLACACVCALARVISFPAFSTPPSIALFFHSPFVSIPLSPSSLFSPLVPFSLPYPPSFRDFLPSSRRFSSSSPPLLLCALHRSSTSSTAMRCVWALTLIAAAATAAAVPAAAATANITTVHVVQVRRAARTAATKRQPLCRNPSLSPLSFPFLFLPPSLSLFAFRYASPSLSPPSLPLPGEKGIASLRLGLPLSLCSDPRVAHIAPSFPRFPCPHAPATTANRHRVSPRGRPYVAPSSDGRQPDSHPPSTPRLRSSLPP